MKSPKIITGYVLFIFSFLAWIGIGVLQFLNLSVAQNASISGGLFIVGEVTFYISIVLLGNTFWQKIKDWFRKMLIKTGLKSNPKEDDEL